MKDETVPTETPRHALIFGASGLIGRHLALRLVAAGAQVTLAVRSHESGRKLDSWLINHGLTVAVNQVIVDFDAPTIMAGHAAQWQHITEVHNCAGTYRFGMTAQEARAANVGIVEKVLEFAAGLKNLTRLLHISGYRVGGQNPAAVPWDDAFRKAEYARLGAYEASKVESDAIFQARALELDIPWTIVNPSSVIGDSETGESEQNIGLASTIAQLWEGKATALPGNAATFLPIVTVDYFAQFMVEAAADPTAVKQQYWVLDSQTPSLSQLLVHAGEHLGARVPRLRVPTSIITRLPQWLTKADPETLTFLSTDRYPTQSAEELAARHGLSMPDALLSLERWVDYLAAHRFGAAVPGDSPAKTRRITTLGAVRTFELGAPDARSLILPGLPVNADTWAKVAAQTGARAVDLPGLGLSSGEGITDWNLWLPELLGAEPVHLIGHSIGAAAAVVAASRNPEKVASLTLVAPFFLQDPSRIAGWQRPLVRAVLKNTTPERLSVRLTGNRSSANALESSVQDLKRHSASRVAAHLASASSERWQRELRGQLSAFEGEVRIITGTQDPLSTEATQQLSALPNTRSLSIHGAGHHPQLTHADELATLMSSAWV